MKKLFQQSKVVWIVCVFACAAGLLAAEIGDFQWARKLYDPANPSLTAVGLNGDIESATNVESVGESAVMLDQWSGDNKAGGRSWAGNTLVATPGTNVSLALDAWEIQEGGPFSDGSWKYFPRQMQDAQFRFGFLNPAVTNLPVTHGTGFGLGSALPYNAILVCLPFRIWLGSGDTVWQPSWYAGNPLQAGVWQVQAGQTIQMAQQNQTNRIGTLQFLGEITPEQTPSFKFQVGTNGTWQLLTDIDRDGEVDIDVTSEMSGNRSSDYPDVSEASGLFITTGAAGGMRSGRVGRSPMMLTCRKSADETVPVEPRNRRPLYVTIPSASFVSPVTIEGKRWNENYRVWTVASTLVGSNEVNYLDTRNFLFDLPLDPATNTIVAFSQNCRPAAVVTGQVEWTALDLSQLDAARDLLNLKEGQQVLLTATGPGSVLTIDLNGDGIPEFTGVPGQKFVYTAGVDPVTPVARIDGNIMGSLAIHPLHVVLPERILACVGHEVKVPIVIPTTMDTRFLSFSAANPAILRIGAVTTQAQNRVSVALTALARGSPVLQVRYGPDLLASKEVTEFTAEDTIAGCAVVDADTGESQGEIIVRPYIPNIGVKRSMFASQSCFGNGDFQSFTYPEEFRCVFDEVTGENIGIASFSMFVPTWEHSSCYATTICGAHGGATTGPIDWSQPIVVLGQNTGSCKAKVSQVNLLVNGGPCNLYIQGIYGCSYHGPHSVSLLPTNTPCCIGSPLPGISPTTFVCEPPSTYTYAVTANAIDSVGRFNVKVANAIFSDRVHVYSVEFIQLLERVCTNAIHMPTHELKLRLHAPVSPATFVVELQRRPDPITTKGAVAFWPDMNSTTTIVTMTTCPTDVSLFVIGTEPSDFQNNMSVTVTVPSCCGSTQQFFTVADMDRLTVTENLHTSNTMTDATPDDPPQTSANTLYVCQNDSNQASICLDPTWNPIILSSNLFRWTISNTNTLYTTSEWSPNLQSFATPANSTWSAGTGLTTNREYRVWAWYPCNFLPYSYSFDLTKPHRMVYLNVVDLARFTLNDPTNDPPSVYGVNDDTRADEPRTIDNTLYVCQDSNGLARINMKLSWLPPNTPPDRFRWRIENMSGAPVSSTIWPGGAAGTFVTNPVSTVWTNAGTTPQRDFQVRTWFDCNGNNAPDTDEPHRLLYVTVLNLELEPITTEPGNGAEIYNPCVIPTETPAKFQIKVEPASVTDSQIAWSQTTGPGTVTFPGGNSGRLVQAQGNTVGDVKLQIQVANFHGPAPTIEAVVYTQNVINVRAWIVCLDNGSNAATTASAISSDIDGANRIFQQTNMKFNLVSVGTISNSAWWQISSASNYAGCAPLVNYTNGTDGLEVYYVDGLGPSTNTLAGLSFFRFGIVMRASLANGCVLAHEIGHACGLEDIYTKETDSLEGNPSSTLAVSGLVALALEPRDWNSGSSPLYYFPVLSQANLIRRLLMFGGGNTNVLPDISNGTVVGVGVTNLSTGVSFSISPVKTGVKPGMIRKPIHDLQ